MCSRCRHVEPAGLVECPRIQPTDLTQDRDRSDAAVSAGIGALKFDCMCLQNAPTSHQPGPNNGGVLSVMLQRYGLHSPLLRCVRDPLRSCQPRDFEALVCEWVDAVRPRHVPFALSVFELETDNTDPS